MSERRMMSRITILHVEDDSNDVLLLKHACEYAGVSLNVQTVEDGDEAIAYLSGKGQFADRKRFPLPTCANSRWSCSPARDKSSISSAPMFWGPILS